MRERIILYADEGKLLTDGETYGKQVLLAENADKSAFREISREEAQRLQITDPEVM